ncbi:hypothetical protein [Candidatus Odyssella acanthamoebae]|uniref:Uncharacterized protein n=1 Tax=Candidatus Odyssella acanthamoebae TaxID=91604 RepID=A0A077AQU3_9PROT|nr:hypothetical protein [Candidatus Paracaedibacter acanthamoebae]AIK95547.1 hypothetical protein ID47_00370 [Candidatus Paracaedibacter acanthamoebae]
MKLFYQYLGLYLLGMSALYAQDTHESPINKRRSLSNLSPFSANFNYSDAFQQPLSTTNKYFFPYVVKRTSKEDILKKKIASYFEEPKLAILEEEKWESILPSLLPEKTSPSTMTSLTLENFYQAEKQKKEEYLTNASLRLIKAAQQLKHPSYQWKKPIKADDLPPLFLNRILKIFPQFFITKHSAYSVEEVTRLEELMINIGCQYGFSPTVSQFVLNCIWKAHDQHLSLN